MTNRLEDKVVIITGSGDGMGRVMAKMFAAEGAKLTLAARRAELLEEAAAEVASAGGRALVVRTDVTSEEQVVAMVAAIASDRSL